MVAHSIFCYFFLMYPTIFFVISVSALFKNPSYVFLIREVYSLHTYTQTHTQIYTVYIYILCVYIYICINTYYYYHDLLLLLLYWVLYGFYPTCGPQPKPNSMYSKTRIIRGTMKVLRNSEFEEIHFKALLATCRPSHFTLGRNDFNVIWILIIKYYKIMYSKILYTYIYMYIYIYIYWHSWLHMCTVHIKIEM